jgi:hypothetical protein
VTKQGLRSQAGRAFSKAMAAVPDRALGAVIGGIVADAATMGLHW